MARTPSRFTLYVLVGVVALAGGIVGYKVRSTRSFFDPRLLLSRFPAEDALAASVDFATLRAAGLLGAPATTLEPEYKQFLEGTGFDYRRDLDSVTASFSRSGSYFIVRGRFNWKKLRDYATQQGGACYQDLCRVQGSRPDRRISFLPLRDDAMALAVSGNDLAATLLTQTAQPIAGEIPNATAWISVPGVELRRQEMLPPQMHSMLSALNNADRIVITFGPDMQAHLEATCRTKTDAGVLASQLRIATGALKEALARDNKASNDEVTILLTGGSFDQNDRRVTGRWPVRKTLLDALTSGI